jgi:hypothetical protein
MPPPTLTFFDTSKSERVTALLSGLVHTLCSARMLGSAVFSSLNLRQLMRRMFFAWPNSSEVLMNYITLVVHTLCLEQLYA